MRSTEGHETGVAIDELYRGSLDTFVSRRDALTKELRRAGDRAAAAMVKALRKPSRAAWALNLRMLHKPDAMAELDAAIRDAVASSPSGDDGRAFIASLRVGIRQFAVDSAKLAKDAGVEVGVEDLVAVLSAVLGREESFQELRRARLTDVPEAGGLDLLALLPTQNSRESAPPSPAKASAAESDEAKARRDRDEDVGRAAARAAAKGAASRLASARKRAGEARSALEEANANVSAAETRMREAEEQSRRARAQRDAARDELDGAEAAVKSAEDELHLISSEPGAV